MFIQTTFSQAEKQLVSRFSKNLNILEAELNMTFQERPFLIRQFLLSLICGRNVLVYGTHGTAKTKIAKAIFDSIQGKGVDGKEKHQFEIQFDTETNMDEVVGPMHPEIYQKQGIVVRNVEGYLPTADFALLDEYFEALSVLRATNDIMNEKVFQNGPQQIQAPLLQAIATTNRKPEEIAAIYQMLSLPSVNDRFLCVSEVDNIKDDENLDQMLINFVMGMKPTARLDFADVQRIIELIGRTNQFPNADYLRVFRQALRAYETKVAKKNGGVVLPSRRWAWLTQVVEANALLEGRTELFVDDILSTVYALAHNEESQEYVTFMETVPPILEKAKAELGEDVDKVQKNLLERIESEIKQINDKIADPAWSAQATPSIIGSTVSRIAKIQSEIEAIKPTLRSNVDLKSKLLAQAEKVNEKVLKSLK